MKMMLNDFFGRRVKIIGEAIQFSGLSGEVTEFTPHPRSDEDSKKSMDALEKSVNEAGGHQAFLGFPDFLPFSFLETGMRTGRAVCCIFRRFSTPKSSGALMDLMREDIPMQEVVF